MYDFCMEQEFRNRLECYVNLDTPTGDCEQMQIFNTLLEQDLTAAGASVTRYPSATGDILAAEVGNGSHCVLLLGHKDTVFPVGTAEQNPFRTEEREGRTVLRGPGVLDMKSGVCMAVELLRHFYKNPLPDWRVTALFNCDEEIGSPESRETICRMLSESDFCLCMEPANAGQCVTSRKGIASFRITAHGIAAHSGVNYTGGASAIEAICRIIAKAYAVRDDEHGLSINIGLLNAPGKRNIVADFAEAQGEFRCFDPKRIEAACDELRQLVENNPVERVHCTLERFPGRPAMVETEISKQLFAIAKSCAEMHGMTLSGCARGGGSDAAFASQMNVPVLDGMGAEGAGPHTPDEFVYYDTIQKRLQICADTITQAAASKFFLQKEKQQ